MEFFRHCPGCGRRFHIKLESKKMVGVDREPMPRATRTIREPRTDLPTIPIVVHDERPVVVDIEDFQYTYICKHCGHEWIEKRVKEEREKPGKL